MLDKVKKNFYPKGRGIEDSALEDIKKYSVDDFILENYDPHPPIKAEMAV